MKTTKKNEVPLLPQRRNPFHKGDAGRIAVMAGSSGMIGAACLTARSALRSGAGLVYTIVPESILHIFQTKLTEVICVPVADSGHGFFTVDAADAILSFAAGCDGIALGPGMGRSEDTRKAVNYVLQNCERPVVIDADGFVLTEKDVLRQRNAASVITPHPGEMALWLGKNISDIQRDRKKTAIQVSEEFQCVVVLKGDKTIVADHGRIYVNASGNPGMAAAGSGDVLSGVIAALIGQGMGAYDAAVLGVYLHGLAGDAAAEKLGEHSLIASDIIEFLPDAFIRHGK